MPQVTVWTFFYGSNINLGILKKVDYIPRQVHVARLHGFDIQIRPLANLVRSDQHCVYGILATGTHDELERLYGRLRAEGFEVLAISIDARSDLDEVVEFQRELGLSFPVLLDPRQTAHSAFGVSGVPETYLIDSQGRLAEHFIGPRNWDDPRYARAVRRLLAADPGAAGLADG